MTAGLIQDADLDTDTVARADTKPLLAARLRALALHSKVDPATRGGVASKPYYKKQTRGEPPELNHPEVSREPE